MAITKDTHYMLTGTLLRDRKIYKKCSITGNKP